jgi:hypothetical protein
MRRRCSHRAIRRDSLRVKASVKQLASEQLRPINFERQGLVTGHLHAQTRQGQPYGNRVVLVEAVALRTCLPGRDTSRAMSHENVEIIRRGYEALNRRDVDTWLNGFHADAEVHDLPTIPDAPVYRGHYALRNWVEMIRDVWTEESYYELEKLTAGG